MLPEIALLLELQRRDSALAETKRRLAEIPKRRRALETALERARMSLAGIQRELDAARLERRRLEKEVEGFQAEAARLERQLFDVKTNDEFTAMRHQIANVQSKRSDGETAILETMEREESTAARVRAGEREAADAERSLREGHVTLEKEAAELEAEAAERVRHRDDGRAPLAPALLAKYDRLLAGREGVAIVAIENHACGACHRALTAHDLQLAKQGETMLTCEGCGRILAPLPRP
jgi:predicted  nucleic acid-binding Zn-ribbon protein